MNAASDSGAASTSPRSMAWALSWLNCCDQVLKDATSSSLEMLWAGVYRPVPLITTLCTVVPLFVGHRHPALAGNTLD